MTKRRFIIGSLLTAAAGAAVFFAWRWLTTPAVPEVALDRTDTPLVQLVEQAQTDVRRQPRTGKTWGKLGMVLAANSFVPPARECFANAERFDPSDERWPYLRGESLRQESRLHEAIPLLRHALAVSRTSHHRPTIVFRLAWALIDEGELDEAERQVDALSAMGPDAPQVHFVQGLMARARGNRSAAKAHLRKLVGEKFSQRTICTMLAALCDDDRAEARHYQQLAAAAQVDVPWPDSIVGELAAYSVSRSNRIRDVNLLLDRGDVAQARDLAKQIAAEAPNIDNQLMLVTILNQLQEFDEAERTLQKALEAHPKHATARALMGQMLLLKGKSLAKRPEAKTSAEELFRQTVAAEDQALSLDNKLLIALQVRAEALQLLGRKEEALRDLRLAVQYRPEFAYLHQALGEALAEAGQLKEALEHLEDAVRLAVPADPRPREALEKWRTKANGS